MKEFGGAVDDTFHKIGADVRKTTSAPAKADSHFALEAFKLAVAIVRLVFALARLGVAIVKRYIK